jgi:hypothetical protein
MSDELQNTVDWARAIRKDASHPTLALQLADAVIAMGDMLLALRAVINGIEVVEYLATERPPQPKAPTEQILQPKPEPILP